MAIRIVDETPHPGVIRTAICKQCGTKIEFLPIDIQAQPLYSMGEYECTSYSVQCPKCKSNIDVKNS